MLPFRVVTFDPGRDDAFDHPVVLRRVAGDELFNDRELLGGADKEAGQGNRAVVVA